jgi:hypothetical protein
MASNLPITLFMTTSTHTIVGVYGSPSEAKKAVHDLETEGFSHEQISVVAANSPAAPKTDAPNIGPLENIGSDTSSGAGAAVGTVAGFFAGMVALAIPGIGPIIAAGPLAAGLMGAGIGAAAGGVAGALRSHGIPEQHAGRYSDAVARGSCLVLVHADELRANHAADVLDRNGAIRIDDADDRPATRRLATPEALQAAKLKPGEGVRDRQRENERRSSVYPGVTGSGPTPSS